MRRISSKQFLQNISGATIVEFAVLAPVFFVLLLATIEFGLYLFTYVTLESAVTQSARAASVNSGLKGNIEQFVTQDILARARWIPTDQKIIVSAQPVAGSGSGTLPPDICDVNGTVTTDCNCAHWIEVNNETGCQTSAQVQVGGSNDLIEIRASVPWKVHLPLISRFFQSTDTAGTQHQGTVMITTTAVVRNEPWFPNNPGGEENYGDCCVAPPLDGCPPDAPECEGGGGEDPKG